MVGRSVGRAGRRRRRALAGPQQPPRQLTLTHELLAHQRWRINVLMNLLS